MFTFDIRDGTLACLTAKGPYVKGLIVRRGRCVRKERQGITADGRGEVLRFDELLLGIVMDEATQGLSAGCIVKEGCVCRFPSGGYIDTNPMPGD